eukprot:365607-Chlamydomonas_euryale.AAC.14
MSLYERSFRGLPVCMSGQHTHLTDSHILVVMPQDNSCTAEKSSGSGIVCQQDRFHCEQSVCGQTSTAGCPYKFHVEELTCFPCDIPLFGLFLSAFIDIIPATRLQHKRCHHVLEQTQRCFRSRVAFSTHRMTMSCIGRFASGRNDTNRCQHTAT